MIYFIEQWNPTEKWLALSHEERAAYIGNVGAAIESLVEQGVEIVTWSVNDQDTSNRAAYDYFAIWKFPNQELANYFQQVVSGAGWYDYFSQVNLQGKQDTAQNVLGALISL